MTRNLSPRTATIKARKVAVIENLKSLLALEKIVAGIENDGASKADIVAINAKLATIDSTIAVDDINLNTLQKIVTYIKATKTKLESLVIADVAGLQSALNLKADKSFVQGVETGLNTEITAIKEVLKVDDTSLDELQEIVDFINLNREDLENLTISSIAGLQAALDGKAAKTHTHSSDDVDYKGKSLTTKLAELESAVAQVLTSAEIDHGSTKLDVKITAMDKATVDAEKRAKDYVDTKTTALDTELLGDINNVKKENKEYTDAKAATATGTAKSYTDAELRATEVSLAGKITTAEEAAKTDTDTKVGAAKTAGTKYTDGKIKVLDESAVAETTRVNGELDKGEKERNVMMFGTPENQNIPAYNPEIHVSGDIVLVGGEVCILD